MKKKVCEIVCIASLLLFALVSVFTISLLYYQNSQRKLDSYNKFIASYTQEEINHLFECADEYNSVVANANNISLARLAPDPRAVQDSNQSQQLDNSFIKEIGEDKVIGFVSIEKIGLLIPILNTELAHNNMESFYHKDGTSYPSNSGSVSTVLSCYADDLLVKNSKFLEKLVIGDMVNIQFLGKSFSYKIDKLERVYDDSYYQLENDKNYLTLEVCDEKSKYLIRGENVVGEVLALAYVKNMQCVDFNSVAAEALLTICVFSSILIIIVGRGKLKKRKDIKINKIMV